MKINSKTLFLLIFFVSIASALFIIFKIDQSKQKETLITERFNYSPQIPNYFAGGLLLELNITKRDFSFPEKLPYLTQSTGTPFSQTEIQKISSSLGFNFDPIVIKDIENGETFIWNSDAQSLMVTPKLRRIKIIPPNNPRVLIQKTTDKKLTEEQYKILGDEFLTQKIPFNLDDLKFMGFIYLKTEAGLELFRKTTRDNSEFVQLNYYQNPLEYPLLGINPQDSQIIIQFLKDGSLLNFEATLPSTITQSPNEFPLKGYDELIKSIDESVLVSLNDGNINLPDIEKSKITDVVIDKISLAYLIDMQNNEIIQPVFLLEGTANIPEYTNIPALFYLPAFSQLIQP